MPWMLLITAAFAGDWKEITCSPDCVVIIGKEIGPVASIRYPVPLGVPTTFVIGTFQSKPDTRAHTQLRFRKGERPAWISVGHEQETVYYGLQKGPTFAEVSSLDVGGNGKLYIGAYDGEQWKRAVWDPQENTLIFQEDLLQMGYDMPATHLLDR